VGAVVGRRLPRDAGGVGYWARVFLGWGWLQTLADVFKLLQKEDIIPERADRLVFIVAPFLVFIPAFLVYVVIPFGEGHLIAADLNIGILYILAVTSIAVVGIIAAGWASDNKYSLLGGLRSAAQLLTYEVPMTLAVIAPILLAGTLSMQGIVAAQKEAGWFWEWYLFSPAFLSFIVYFISALAETNHTPFDLPEAESELVAGFHVEYSGMKFAMFFLAEFANVFTVCAIATTLFLGGWHSPFPHFMEGGIWSVFWFLLKSGVGVLTFMWLRATLPRIRIDQMMSFGWKFLIPLALLSIALTGGWIVLRG
jgi:NADH-quinone oxidoreductase subunit H